MTRDEFLNELSSVGVTFLVVGMTKNRFPNLC